LPEYKGQQAAQAWALRDPTRKAGELAGELAADCQHRPPLALLAGMVDPRLGHILGLALEQEAQSASQEDLQSTQQQIFPQLEARAAAADRA
jgi:hypothetical protein